MSRLAPIPGLQGLSAYHVPKHPAPIDLPLHGNEGPPPTAALMATTLSPDAIRRYPSAAVLEARLADRIGVPRDWVLVTAGADEALDRAFRSYVQAGDEVILPSPTFVMLPHYARVVGAVIKAPAWPAEDFPEREVLAAIGERTRAIALVSPNNPTGAVIDKDAIVRIAGAAQHALMLVDFAYVETAADDPTAELVQLDNVLVFRTLSKVWGLAGLRVGYVVGRPELVRPLRAAGPPYSVTAPSVALAVAHLASGYATMQAYVDAVKIERDVLYDVMSECGLAPVRSQANFVFARCGSEAKALWVRDGLAALGIGVRVFPGEPGLEDGLRVTCPGNEAQAARLYAAIRAVTSPAAWVYVTSDHEVKAARAMFKVPLIVDDAMPEPDRQSWLASGVARVVASEDELREVWS